MHALSQSTVIGIVGAGAMGAGIAQIAAQAGHPVRLYDSSAHAAALAVDRINLQWDKQLSKGRMSPDQRERCRRNLQHCEGRSALAEAGLIVEAIVENLEIKQQLFRELETVCAPDCILASNTSSLSITRLATGLNRPERLIGMHFFNPAPLMPLVEIVSGLDSDPALAACLYETAAGWGKKPVHTRSTPGFIVNRVARPFYAENLRLLQENAADYPTLDALMRESGHFKMGAFELMDLIGHDVNYAVTCSVFEAYYGDFRFQPSLIQKELVDAGRLGRKSGRGFYDYSGNDTRGPAPALPSKSTANIESCVIEGDLGPAQPLADRLRAYGILVIERDGPGWLRVGEATVALTDGRMACQRQREEGVNNLALFDLAYDYTTVSRLGIAFAENIQETAREQIIALFHRAGIRLSALSDTPGLAVMRTVSMLVNEAADAVLQGVASVGDIDLAMCAGVNYPRGPLRWADMVGLENILTVLSHLQQSYGEDRYRPSLLLRRLTLEKRNFHERYDSHGAAGDDPRPDAGEALRRSHVCA